MSKFSELNKKATTDNWEIETFEIPPTKQNNDIIGGDRWVGTINAEIDMKLIIELRNNAKHYDNLFRVANEINDTHKIEFSKLQEAIKPLIYFHGEIDE